MYYVVFICITLIILLVFRYLSNLCKVTVNIIMYKSFLVFLWIMGCKEKSQNSNESWLLIYV